MTLTVHHDDNAQILQRSSPHLHGHFSPPPEARNCAGFSSVQGPCKILSILVIYHVRRQFLLVPQGDAENVSQIHYPRRIQYNKLSTK